jgi:hypothetical protein
MSSAAYVGIRIKTEEHNGAGKWVAVPSNNEMQLTKGVLGGVSEGARIIVTPFAADLGVR